MECQANARADSKTGRVKVAAGVSHDIKLGVGFLNSPGDGDSDADDAGAYLAAGYDAVVSGSHASFDLLTDLVDEMAQGV